MSNALKIIAAFVAGALIAVLAMMGLTRTGLFEPPQRSVTTTEIAGAFTDIAELAVEEYNYSKMGRYEDAGLKALGITIPLTGKHFVVTYSGVVKAGLNDVTEIDVRIDDVNKRIIVSTPPVQILSSTISPSSVVVYDQSFNPLNQLSVDELSTFLAAEEKAADERAREMGLVKRGEERVAALLSGQAEAFTEGSTLEDYEVEVRFRLA